MRATSGTGEVADETCKRGAFRYQGDSLRDGVAEIVETRAIKVGQRRTSIAADVFGRLLRQPLGGTIGQESATPKQVTDYSDS